MHIGFNHHRQFGSFPGGDGRQHLFDRTTRPAGRFAVTIHPGPIFGNFTRPCFALNNNTAVTGHWRTVQPQNFNGLTRASRFQCLATVIEKCPHTPIFGTDNKNIALSQCAALHQQGGNRTFAALNF